MYKTLNAPLSVHLELTTLCNHKCFHCYNHWRNDDDSADYVMNENLAGLIVKQLSDSKIFHVVLNGGEPITNLNTLLTTARLLKDADITFSLNSNLCLVGADEARLLKDAGIKTVLTSLLSFDEKLNDYLVQKNGSFKKLMSGIGFCQDEGINVAVNMVVMKSNFNHVYQTGIFCKGIGVNSFSATRALLPKCASREFVRDSLLNKEEAAFMVHQLVKLQKAGIKISSLIPYPTCFLSDDGVKYLGTKTCSAGKTSFVISANGEVRACPHDSTSVGLIQRDGINEIWKRLYKWRNGSLIPDECRSCRLVGFCGGGCRMATINDSINESDRLCFGSKRLPMVSSQPIKLISERDALKIVDYCRFRFDNELGIINTGGITNTFVSLDTAKFLFDLKETKSYFSAESLVLNGIDMSLDECLTFLSSLKNKRVIEIVRKEDAV